MPFIMSSFAYFCDGRDHGVRQLRNIQRRQTAGSAGGVVGHLRGEIAMVSMGSLENHGAFPWSKSWENRKIHDSNHGKIRNENPLETEVSLGKSMGKSAR